MPSNMSLLQETTDGRKSRLQALRAKRTASEREQEDSTNSHKGAKKPLKFRNYNPQTEELKENKLSRTLPESVDDQVTEQIQAAGQAHVEEVNLSNLAPKKIDWDLKRDVAKKLDKLQKQTQKAVIELIRERIESDGTSLASAVASLDSTHENQNDDDVND